MIGRRGFLAGTAVVACGGPAPGVPAPRVAEGRLPETSDTIDELVTAWRAKMSIVGLSVAVVCDGELAFARGYGEADREAKVAADADTLYAVGSLTKPYTALTALRAAADGKLDLDAPLKKYLPELRTGGAAAEAITPRLLLCHRSGLPSDWNGGSMGAGPPWAELVREIADEPLCGPVDGWFSYSNVGYTLLAHALERACGRPFAELLASAVAAETGAPAPGFSPPPAGLAAYFQGRRLPEPPLRLLPAAGLHASVTTMVPMLRWLLAGGPVAARMFESQPSRAIDLDERWGLGLGLGHVGLAYAGRVGAHLGRTFCHRSVMFALPDHGLAIVVLTNSREGTGVEALAISVMQTALLERHGIDLPPTRGDAAAGIPSTSLGLAELQAHAGRYATDGDLTELVVEDGALVSRSEAGNVSLRPSIIAGEFVSSKNFDTRVRLRAIGEHHVLSSRVREVESRVAVRCTAGPVPDEWWRRLGTYRVVPGEGEVLAFHRAALVRDGDLLCLRVDATQVTATLARYALVIVGPDDARIFGVGRGKGQRIAAEDGPDGTVLRWAGYRLVREPPITPDPA